MCFFPFADCVIQSFMTGERLPHQNSEENAVLQPPCPVSAWGDINGLQCQQWRMVLSHLGTQSSMGRHEPLPALGFAGRGCVCMRTGAQQHVFPTRAAFNYTIASWTEARILAKGFCFFLQSFSQFVHLPLSWITPKIPKSNRICNDETGGRCDKEQGGVANTFFSPEVQPYKGMLAVKGTWYLAFIWSILDLLSISRK